MKRLAVMLLCAFFLIMLIPIMIVVLLMVYLEDRKNPVLRQPRVGKGARVFTCYKVRTMKADTADRPSHETSEMQITKSGHFMRKTKLDELPQLVNVFLGQMAFVGPRPCLPAQTALIAAREELGVYNILPGITGLAQINGIDMSDPDKLAAIDADYVQRKSFMLDLKIIGRTLKGSGSGDRTKKSG